MRVPQLRLRFLERDVASLSVWDIDQARAADLAERLRGVTSVEISVAPPDAKSDVAINATPLAMDENDPVPFSLERLRNDALVADAIMKPPRTKLLRKTERPGHPIQEGRHMTIKSRRSGRSSGFRRSIRSAGLPVAPVRCLKSLMGLHRNNLAI